MGGGLLLSWGGGVVVLFLFYLAFAPAGTSLRLLTHAVLPWYDASRLRICECCDGSP